MKNIKKLMMIIVALIVLMPAMTMSEAFLGDSLSKYRNYLRLNACWGSLHVFTQNARYVDQVKKFGYQMPGDHLSHAACLSLLPLRAYLKTPIQ